MSCVVTPSSIQRKKSKSACRAFCQNPAGMNSMNHWYFPELSIFSFDILTEILLFQDKLHHSESISTSAALSIAEGLHCLQAVDRNFVRNGGNTDAFQVIIKALLKQISQYLLSHSRIRIIVLT